MVLPGAKVSEGEKNPVTRGFKKLMDVPAAETVYPKWVVRKSKSLQAWEGNRNGGKKQ